MASSVSSIASRGTAGVCIASGSPVPNNFEWLEKDKRVYRTCTYDRDGRYFAWTTPEKVIVISTAAGRNSEPVLTLDRPKAVELSFSPKANFLSIWEQYSVAKGATQQENANLHIYNIESGECIRSLIQKKQQGWEPQWTDDEVLAARNVNNEIHFFEKQSFEVPSKKIHLHKVSEFSLSRGPPPYHVACYVPGVQGQPSYVRLYRYPKFDGVTCAVANKSFFKADKVDLFWNDKGTGLIIFASTDVDKTGQSYYGEQMLYFMSTKGDTCIVQLAKKGPVYSVKWSPSNTEFCVVYGFMPAKATIFNMKCEPVFDFGTGPRNQVWYNAHGTMLALAGFGNLRGNIEVWDIQKKRLIIRTVANDSTQISWCPDGEHFMTATTSPKLRVCNGYQIWHYTGQSLYENKCEMNEEMYYCEWRPVPAQQVKPKALQYNPLKVQEANTPAQSKVPAYRPPGARVAGQTAAPPCMGVRLRGDFEPPSNQRYIPGLGPQEVVTEKPKKQKKPKKPVTPPPPPSRMSTGSDDDFDKLPELNALKSSHEEREKKMKAIRKKLKDIQKLKEKQVGGEQLEKNQLNKIKGESDLVRELEALEICLS